jgi:putative inorganic carbon (hco3(-)) transporter
LILARRLSLALLATLPLIAWPGLPQPFSTPKLWTLAAAAALLAAFAAIAAFVAFVRPTRAGESRHVGHLLAMCWLASWTWSALAGDVVSFEALMLAYATALLAIGMIEIAPAPVDIATAMVVGATGVAIVAVAQAAGIDPFALAGWIAPIGGGSARLRIYGTLGNPDFVAALLVASTPLTVGLLVQRLAANAARGGLAAPGRLPACGGRAARGALTGRPAAVALALAATLAAALLLLSRDVHEGRRAGAARRTTPRSCRRSRRSSAARRFR